jgi:RHH-type proline utilization regulon transcriptional repressor/proline dehydrogenase/delta 1-pyrroline-5-carboxylate dehydrogenase
MTCSLQRSGLPKRCAVSRDGETAASVTALHRALAEATGGDPDIAVYDGQVTTAGRIELLPFLHEQSITITAHRFGNPDRWSEQVPRRAHDAVP